MSSCQLWTLEITAARASAECGSLSPLSEAWTGHTPGANQPSCCPSALLASTASSPSPSSSQALALRQPAGRSVRLQLICAHHLNGNIPSELRHAKSACGKHVLAVRRVVPLKHRSARWGSVWTDALPRVRWCVEVTAKMALPRLCLAKRNGSAVVQQLRVHFFEQYFLSCLLLFFVSYD